jgi:hypothetical protein
MNTTPLYVLDRSLCARCGNDGHLMGEGKYEGCPDCPTGRVVIAELKAIEAERLAEYDQPEGWDDEPDEWQGHFFPSPQELGCDPESVAWTHGNCACGTTHADYQASQEACPL